MLLRKAIVIVLRIFPKKKLDFPLAQKEQRLRLDGRTVSVKTTYPQYELGGTSQGHLSELRMFFATLAF